MGEQSWRLQAACLDMDTQIFYPQTGGSVMDAPLSVCADCPVRLPCLNFGLHEDYGIWGGKNERQRKIIRKARWRERAG